MNSNHVENFYSKAISSFIDCLNFTREYRDYFGWHGFNKREDSHMEEMIKRHGANFIVKKII